MSKQLIPPTYTPLATACKGRRGEFFNLIGLVSDVQPRKPTNNPAREVMTFELLDDSLLSSGDHAYGVKVRFFVPKYLQLPDTMVMGDIIVLKDVESSEYQGSKLFGHTPGRTEWCLLPSKSIPETTFSHGFLDGKQALPSKESAHFRGRDGRPLSPKETDYIIQLRNMRDTFAQCFRSLLPSTSAHSGGVHITSEKRPAGADLNHEYKRTKSSGPVNSLMQDIGMNRWYNMTVQIVKKYDRYPDYELSVTDYTSNTGLSYYPAPEEPITSVRGKGGDTLDLQKGWRGPYGQQVLRVTIKDQWGTYACHNFSEGDIVKVLNLKISPDKLGSMEGTIWPDQRYPDKQRIFHATGELVEALQQRKQQYEAERARIEGRHTITSAALAEEDEGGKHLSKSARAKQRKKEKRQSKQQEREQQEDVATEREQQEDMMTERELPAGLDRSNQNVRCSHQDMHLSTVDDMLDKDDSRRHIYVDESRGINLALPFVNVNFRARVSVSDYRYDIEDFAVLREVADATQSSGGRREGGNGVRGRTAMRWQWNFRLQVKDDAGTAMILDVGHKQAEFLFGNFPDADNLRENQSLLHKLKEKMFCLWGDLEELKAAEGDIRLCSNKPFECCIAEYGDLKEDGRRENRHDWERRYMMHGVTIL